MMTCFQLGTGFGAKYRVTNQFRRTATCTKLLKVQSTSRNLAFLVACGTTTSSRGWDGWWCPNGKVYVHVVSLRRAWIPPRYEVSSEGRKMKEYSVTYCDMRDFMEEKRTDSIKSLSKLKQISYDKCLGIARP